MVKVVFDTVVFVRSLINPYSFWGKLVFEYSNHYRLFVSQPILVEMLEVFQRPEITKKFKNIEGLDRNKILEIISQAEVVEIEEIPPVSRDIKDNKFLATAQVSDSDYIVTEDEDLLVLKEYTGIKIINTATFLKYLDPDKKMRLI